MWPNLQETTDLVTFTEEILNGKLHILCSVIRYEMKSQDFITFYLGLQGLLWNIRAASNINKKGQSIYTKKFHLKFQQPLFKGFTMK